MQLVRARVPFVKVCLQQANTERANVHSSSRTYDRIQWRPLWNIWGAYMAYFFLSSDCVMKQHEHMAALYF